MSGRRILRTLLISLVVVVIGLHLAFFTTVGILSAVYRTRNPRATALMRYRSLAEGAQKPPEYRPLKLVPETLVRAVIYIEDVDFYRHHGFDVSSIRYAIRLNRRLGYRAYGGSTITQQLARNLFLVPDKIYLRKYFEILAAVEMELIIPKDRILELYLNVAEWGQGVWGVENAARAYFGCSASGLETEQIIRLVTIMPSPRRYSPWSFGSNDILRRRNEAVDRYVRRLLEPAAEHGPSIRRIDEPETSADDQ